MNRAPLALPGPVPEHEALARLRAIASKNRVMTSFIGQGYYGTFTPGVILRNVLENPAWYTAYTPYQPEISQGRLEALVNYQTMVCDLTAMAITNASMLDEATAAAEAMALALRVTKSPSRAIYVADDVFAQTTDVVRTRAEPMGVSVATGPASGAADADAFAVLLQYPGADGEVRDLEAIAASVHARGGFVIVASDLLALTLLRPPGEWGADAVVGSAQRFGVQRVHGFFGLNAFLLGFPFITGLKDCVTNGIAFSGENSQFLFSGLNRLFQSLEVFTTGLLNSCFAGANHASKAANTVAAFFSGNVWNFFSQIANLIEIAI